jgi:tetratricopeptide (TPR) repeat protein
LQGLREYGQARARAEEALALARSLGNERGIGVALWVVGVSVAGEERFAEAQPMLDDALRRLRALDWLPFVTGALVGNAIVQLKRGSLAQARANFEEALQAAGRHGFYEAADCLLGLAAIAARQGEPVQAARDLAASERLYAESGLVVFPWLPWLQEARDEVRRAVNSQFSAAELEQIAQEVGPMTLDEIIDDALAARPIDWVP